MRNPLDKFDNYGTLQLILGEMIYDGLRKNLTIFANTQSLLTP